MERRLKICIYCRWFVAPGQRKGFKYGKCGAKKNIYSHAHCESYVKMNKMNSFPPPKLCGDESLMKFAGGYAKVVGSIWTVGALLTGAIPLALGCGALTAAGMYKTKKRKENELEEEKQRQKAAGYKFED